MSKCFNEHVASCLFLRIYMLMNMFNQLVVLVHERTCIPTVCLMCAVLCVCVWVLCSCCMMMLVDESPSLHVTSWITAPLDGQSCNHQPIHSSLLSSLTPTSLLSPCLCPAMCCFSSPCHLARSLSSVFLHFLFFLAATFHLILFQCGLKLILTSVY